MRQLLSAILPGLTTCLATGRSHALQPFGSLMLMSLLLASQPAAAERMAVIAQNKPSVVAVGSFNLTQNPQFSFRGTGFAIDDGRLIASNAHVVPEVLEPADGNTVLAIQHTNSQGRLEVRPVKLIGKAPEHDLAVLQLLNGPALPALKLADSSHIREGQEVIFSGFPIGGALGFSPVTHRGMVASITPIALPSANSRQLNAKLLRRLKTGSFNIFQLDATAYPGNSGSPVFHPETGEVIGVINMVFIKSTRESALSTPSGISYALPVNLLRELVSESKTAGN